MGILSALFEGVTQATQAVAVTTATVTHKAAEGVDDAAKMTGAPAIVQGATGAIKGAAEQAVGHAGKISEISMGAFEGIDFAALGRGISGLGGGAKSVEAPKVEAPKIEAPVAAMDKFHVSESELSNLQAQNFGTAGSSHGAIGR